MNLLAILAAVIVISGARGPAYAEQAEDPYLDLGYSRTLFYDVDERDALASTAAWLAQIVEEYGSEALIGSKTQIVHDLASAAEAVRNETVDILILTPLEYLRLQDEVELLPIYVSTVLGSRTVQYNLLVRQDSGITTLSDLANGRLLIDTSGRGALPKMWLETELLARGHSKVDSFFGAVVEATKVSKSVLPVLFGKADACVVPAGSFETMVDLNPQLGRELVSIASSDRFFNGIICARPKFYELTGPILDDVIPNLHETPRGRQMLSLFHVEKLVPYGPEHLDEVINLLNRHTDLTQSYVERH